MHEVELLRPEDLHGQPPRGGPLLAQCRVDRRSQWRRIAPSSLLALGQNRLRHGGHTWPGLGLGPRCARTKSHCPSPEGEGVKGAYPASEWPASWAVLNTVALACG